MLQIMDLAGYLVQYDSPSNLTLAPALSFSLEITTLPPLHSTPPFTPQEQMMFVRRWAIQLPYLVKHEQVVPSLHSVSTFAASTSNLMFRRDQDIGIPYLPWKFVLQYDHPHRYKFASLSCLSMPFFALEEPLNIL